MPKFKLPKGCIYVIVAALIIAGLYSIFWAASEKPTEVTISKIVEQVNGGLVKTITVEDNKLSVDLNNGQKEVAFKEADVSFTDYGIDASKVAIDIKDSSSNGLWITVLSSIVPVILIAAIFWFMIRQAQGGQNQAMNFGRSKARLAVPNGKKAITFKEVAGSEEAKKELLEIVEFLKHPQKFRDLGAEIPKGVLLLGPPGTGKTLMAKAVAGEAGVPFFSISGSEFVEMFVGVGASRVRDLFARAKKSAPAIVFVDEIDAVGRQRGAGVGGSNDEREQTLNQILVEMDGFETSDSVIVIAATNRPDVLDPALLRPGRFDRRVMLALPDVREREAILEVHVRNKPVDKSVDLKMVAKQTPGFSGADLHNLLNEAAILTARHNEKRVTQEYITESIEKVMLGPERKSHLLTDKEKRITAYHEAGHALVSRLLPNCNPVHKVSIISRGSAGGYTWNMPKEDKHMYTRSDFEDELASLLAGKAAEEIIFGESSTGAENDLRRATELARDMIKDYGMSAKLGPVTYGRREELVFLGKELNDEKTYSEQTASEIDEEIRQILEKAFFEAKSVITNNLDKIKEIAEELIVKESLDEGEFEHFFKGYRNCKTEPTLPLNMPRQIASAESAKVDAVSVKAKSKVTQKKPLKKKK